MNEWKPIETAPKDGTEILLTSLSCWPMVVSDHWVEEEEEYPTGPMRGGCWCDWGMPSFGQPTHWMPLPEPPND